MANKRAARRLSKTDADRNTIAVFDALVEAMAPMRRLGIDVNTDLYSVLVYRLLDLPADLSTALFAAGRSAGWVAQIREQQHNNILIRPRLDYAGPSARSLQKRSDVI